MGSLGHVFVIHGSLTELVCDLALIPTARDMYVERYWERYCPGAAGGPRLQDLEPARQALARGDRVGELVPPEPGRPAFRYVDVGLGRGQSMLGDYKDWAVRWLDEGICKALDLVRGDVRGGRVAGDRERPLVAVPALGTGEGGFDAVRGEVTRALLKRCEEAAEVGDFDIAVVCLHRSDFTYLQSQRTAVGQRLLTSEEKAAAERIGELAAAQRLSLFLGAGVSVAAGVPGFPALVHATSVILGGDAKPGTAAEAAATAGSLACEFGEVAFAEAVETALGRTGTALLHGLLASSRSPAVITTNFDDLYERSAAVALVGARPDVLPWERERRTPWLLKIHGSVGRSGRLVITTEDLRSFNSAERPLASVVQAQMLLNEVVFVGYSLRDPNVHELAQEVRDLLRRRGHDTQTVGTILTIEPLGTALDGLQDALEVVDLSRGDATSRCDSARRLEVFCDVVLWIATRLEPSWQLDDRYAVVGDDRVLRDQLRRLDVPTGGTWSQLSQVLRQYGLEQR